MRSMGNVGIWIGLAFCLLAIPSQADMFSPSHSCSKPFKPYEFSSRSERDLFLMEVESYKQCITDFVEEQEDAILRHREAAEEAIEEWNTFVNLELR